MATIKPEAILCCGLIIRQIRSYCSLSTSGLPVAIFDLQLFDGLNASYEITSYCTNNSHDVISHVEYGSCSANMVQL